MNKNNLISSGLKFIFLSIITSIVNYLFISLISNTTNKATVGDFSKFDIAIYGLAPILSLGVGYSIIKLGENNEKESKSIIIFYIKYILPILLISSVVVGFITKDKALTLAGIACCIESYFLVVSSCIRVRKLGKKYGALLLVKATATVAAYLSITSIIEYSNIGTSEILVAIIVGGTIASIASSIQLKLFNNSEKIKLNLKNFTTHVAAGIPYSISGIITASALWLERMHYANAIGDQELGDGYLYYKLSQILPTLLSPAISWMPSLIFSKQNVNEKKLYVLYYISIISCGLLFYSAIISTWNKISNYIGVNEVLDKYMIAINILGACMSLIFSLIQTSALKIGGGKITVIASMIGISFVSMLLIYKNLLFTFGTYATLYFTISSLALIILKK